MLCLIQYVTCYCFVIMYYIYTIQLFIYFKYK